MSLPSRTWAEISLGQIAQNFRALSRLAGAEAVVAAVVKADAYGHGLVPVARACAAAGATHFAVATLDEALALRRAGIAQTLLLLAPLLPEQAESVVRADLVPFVSSSAFFGALADAARNAPFPARCFLSLDSGMGREGMAADALRSLWRQARTTPSLRPIGLASHLASADEDDDTGFSAAQRAAFLALAQEIVQDSTEGIWLSLANSPGLLRLDPLPSLPGVAGVVVRPGVALYGIAPYPGALEKTCLAPALAWRARVTLVRDLPAGATIGYGRTITLTRPSRIATLAVGYGDGLSRRFSPEGTVLLEGERYPLVGRISMDQCQIDVTEAPAVVLGAVATLIGCDGERSQSASEMARIVGTTPHEPTTALLPRVLRRYVR